MNERPASDLSALVKAYDVRGLYPRAARRRPAGKRAVNSSHAKIRAIGEQANATLNGWRLLRKLRCSTTRITDIVKAVLALQVAASV